MAGGDEISRVKRWEPGRKEEMNDRTYRWKSRRAQIDRSQVSLKEEGETSNIEVQQNTQRMALGSGRARIIGDLSKCHFSGGGGVEAS